MTDEAFDIAAFLSACTPQLYVNNCFRLSRLPIGISAREMKRRVDDIRAAIEMNDDDQESEIAFSLDTPPSHDQLRIASRILQDPARRLIDEFFWFWPLEFDSPKADPAIAAVLAADEAKAMEIWHEWEETGSPDESAVAQHNLAIAYHLKALDQELSRLISCGSTTEDAVKRSVLERLDDSYVGVDPLSKVWNASLHRWEPLIDNETVWSKFTAWIRHLDDPRLTTGIARRLRTALPDALDRINASLAVSYAEHGRLSFVHSHVTYMKQSHQGRDDVQATLAVVTDPLKKRVRVAVDTHIEEAKKRPKEANRVAHNLVMAVEEPIRILRLILDEDDVVLIDLADDVAEACLTCQIKFARETDDWKESLSILDRAAKFALSDEQRARIDENREVVAKNHSFGKYIKGIEGILKRLDDNPDIEARAAAVDAELMPWLKKVADKEGASSEVFQDCSDYIASFIRNLSIEIFNHHDKPSVAFSLIDKALAIARSKETRDRLTQDKSQITRLMADASKHNLFLKIRNDEIEVTREFVRYNNQRINSSDIDGIRYGIYIHYTNGIQDSCSYTVAVGSRSHNIDIECKRFFRSEEHARQDWNQIIQAILYQIVPALVTRLAQSIVSGRQWIVSGVPITAQGMTITTGMLFWRKEHLVSLKDLGFHTSQGQLWVSSKLDPKISTSFSIKDVWNAAIMEYIIQGVIEQIEEK